MKLKYDGKLMNLKYNGKFIMSNSKYVSHSLPPLNTTLKLE